MKFLDNINQYASKYDELELKPFLKETAKMLGKHIVLYVMIIYTLISDSKVPVKIKLVFTAAIGYLLLPTDFVADFLPIIGFTDDIAFLTYVVTKASDYITPEVTEQAKSKMKNWLNMEIEDAEIVEENINRDNSES